VTLFHKPSSSASTRAQTILKQAHAQAAAHSTEDQASSHQAQEKLERMEFDLDVTEAPPTGDQLKNILEYLGGASAASQVIQGAQNETDALRKLKENGESFQRPVVSPSRPTIAGSDSNNNRWSTGTRAKLVRGSYEGSTCLANLGSHGRQ
jgi:arsenate reductase-like glutaredoxin family protein